MRITMRKYALLSALLLAVVFLSGCIGQTTTTTTGEGLSISSFASDFSDIRSGEQVTISAMVDNVGEYDATGVSAQLFGLNIGGSEWSLDSQSAQTQTTPLIRKSDATLDLPGESYDFTWSVNSPEDLRVDNTYTANLRVYYKYGTSSTSLMRFMTYDYLKSLPTEDFEATKETTGVTQSASSKAPLSVSLNVGNRPLVVYDDGDTFSVQMDITNADAGNAFDVSAQYPPTAALDSKYLHKVNVHIDTDLDLDCSNTFGSGSPKSGQITLTKGETKTLFCTATIPSKAKLGNTRDYSVTVTLTYGYYIDASTQVTVLKSEAPSTSGTGATTPTTPTSEKTATKITDFAVDVSTPLKDTIITFTGYLKKSDGDALSSRTVYLVDDDGNHLASDKTSSDGEFYIEYKVPSTYAFRARAEFDGSNLYSESTSSYVAIIPQIGLE